MPTIIPLKIVIIGNSGCGKSSLLHVYANNDAFSTNYGFHQESTVGVDFRSKNITIDDIDFKMRIWDTAGQERFRSMIRSYYRSADGIILVFDLTVHFAANGVINWIRELEQHEVMNVPIVIVGNKYDLIYNDDDIAKELHSMINKLIKKFDNITYICSSAKTNYNVSQIFESLAKTISKTHRPLPSKKVSFMYEPFSETNTLSNITNVTNKCSC